MLYFKHPMRRGIERVTSFQNYNNFLCCLFWVCRRRRTLIINAKNGLKFSRHSMNVCCWSNLWCFSAMEGSRSFQEIQLQANQSNMRSAEIVFWYKMSKTTTSRPAILFTSIRRRRWWHNFTTNKPTENAITQQRLIYILNNSQLLDILFAFWKWNCCNNWCWRIAEISRNQQSLHSLLS